MAIDYSVIGSRIKQARLAKNMTQEESFLIIRDLKYIKISL